MERILKGQRMVGPCDSIGMFTLVEKEWFGLFPLRDEKPNCPLEETDLS